MKTLGQQFLIAMFHMKNRSSVLTKDVFCQTFSIENPTPSVGAEKSFAPTPLDDVLINHVSDTKPLPHDRVPVCCFCHYGKNRRHTFFKSNIIGFPPNVTGYDCGTFVDIIKGIIFSSPKQHKKGMKSFNMLDNHLQYWIIVIVIVVKQPAKYSWPFTHFPHPPQLPPKKRQTQLPTPSNLASTKNVCWISVKKNNPPPKKQPTRSAPTICMKANFPNKKTTNKSVGLPGWVFFKVYKQNTPQPLLKDCRSTSNSCGTDGLDAAKAVKAMLPEAGPTPAALLASTKKS